MPPTNPQCDDWTCDESDQCEEWQQDPLPEELLIRVTPEKRDHSCGEHFGDTDSDHAPEYAGHSDEERHRRRKNGAITRRHESTMREASQVPLKPTSLGCLGKTPRAA